jgi:hypothetical protein
METSVRTLFAMINGSAAFGGSAYMFMTARYVSKDGSDSWKSLLNLPARRRFCPQKHGDIGWAQEEPYGGVGEGDLASQLP